MKTKEKSKQKMLLPILLTISLLLAAGGWGTAIYANMTRTPRLNPGASEVLESNELWQSESALIRAFERRSSAVRSGFTGNEVSEDALQLLGWAATGKNRDGTGFVVPLAMGAEPYITLYLAQEGGIRRFS